MTPKETTARLPRQIRVSLGSAIVLGLLDGKLDAAPTTVYLMMYRQGKCNANCGFCPQARESHSRADLLSRVSWPVFPVNRVLSGIGKAVKDKRIKRVCFQALNYPQVFGHLLSLVRTVHRETRIPVSISCQPLNPENIRLLAKAGADRIGIPLDAATKELFDRVKGLHAGGPYTWENQFRRLVEAVRIFGKGGVSTHLIVGLGETEKEMVEVVQRCVDMGVLPALFAFTPIAGTALEGRAQPIISKYRRMQLARHLIVHGTTRYENMRFDGEGCLVDYGVGKKMLMQNVETGLPFLTSGCPDCNRPYYNEKPSGPLYNYPRRITRGELEQIREQLNLD
jgi:biotin synthase